MNFWQYILEPTGASFGPIAVLTILVSAFMAIGGISLVVLPKEFARRRMQNSSKRQKDVGPKEQELRTELRVKVGTGIAVWSAALILSLLLRLLGTPGLSTRLLPTLVILVLPFLIVYMIVYRLIFYPRYLQMCRRIDTTKSYVPVKKKSKSKTKKASTKAPWKQKVTLLPMKAMIGLVSAPVIYYLVMVFIGIPPGVPPQSHDHLLHQLGMPVISLLGYLIGLMMSLGEDLRWGLPFLQPARK